MVINPIVGFIFYIQNSRLCIPNVRIPMDSIIECGNDKLPKKATCQTLAHMEWNMVSWYRNWMMLETERTKDVPEG